MSVSSTVQDWGEWKTSYICPGKYLLGKVAVKSEKYAEKQDDTAGKLLE
jgi:hypothetical protein